MNPVACGVGRGAWRAGAGAATLAVQSVAANDGADFSPDGEDTDAGAPDNAVNEGAGQDGTIGLCIVNVRRNN